MGWLKKKEDELRTMYGRSFLAMGFNDGLMQKQVAAREALQEFIEDEADLAIAGFDFDWSESEPGYALEDENPGQEEEA